MKLAMIKFLIEDAEKEIELMQEFAKEKKRAMKEAEQRDLNYYWNYLNWNKPLPNKQKIKDDLKMVRRLSLEFEKDLDFK